MTRKHKFLICGIAVLVVVFLTGWIVKLYTERNALAKRQEQEFLTRYGAGLNDLDNSLERFGEAQTSYDQISCLNDVLDDLTELKAFMEMHIKLVEDVADADPSAWRETEKLVWKIRHDGEQTEAFDKDGIISESEAAVILMLKEEISILRSDMTVLRDDGNYEYRLTSLEVYSRLKEIMIDTQTQLTEG